MDDVWVTKLAIQEAGQRVSSSVTIGATAVAASTALLRTEMRDRFDEVNRTIIWGAERITGEIEDLGARFLYGLVLTMEQLRIQNTKFYAMLGELYAIRTMLATPVQTRAREYFTHGYAFFSQGLYDKALEYFRRGEAEYDVDFVAQYYMGILCLYGKTPVFDMVDLPAAEAHLRNSLRYAGSVLGEVAEAERYVIDSSFHASVACYAQAEALRHSGAHEDYIYRKLIEAVDLALQSVRHSLTFGEAHYHLAKYGSLLENTDMCDTHLRIATTCDPIYLLRADNDPDIPNTAMLNLARQMSEEVRMYIDWCMHSMRAWIGELKQTFASSNAWDKFADEHSRQAIINDLSALAGLLEPFQKGGPYLDLRLAAEGFNKGLRKFLFSPDGRSRLKEVFGTTTAQYLQGRLDTLLLPLRGEGVAEAELNSTSHAHDFGVIHLSELGSTSSRLQSAWEDGLPALIKQHIPLWSEEFFRQKVNSVREKGETLKRLVASAPRIPSDRKEGIRQDLEEAILLRDPVTISDISDAELRCYTIAECLQRDAETTSHKIVAGLQRRYNRLRSWATRLDDRRMNFIFSVAGGLVGRLFITSLIMGLVRGTSRHSAAKIAFAASAQSPFGLVVLVLLLSLFFHVYSGKLARRAERVSEELMSARHIHSRFTDELEKVKRWVQSD